MSGYKSKATDRWYDKNSRSARDAPRITVWMPTETPHARLQTIAHGCHDPDTLPSGPPVVHVTISGVVFGGYLEDMEMLFEAVQEQVANTRTQYDEMVVQES